MKKICYLFVLVILSLGIYVNPVEGRGDIYSSKAIRALEKLIDSQGNLGTSVTWGGGVPGQDIVWTFDGETNDGTFGYYEDEDQFRFSETVYIATTNQDGIVFGSLGTATKGIDMENSNLSGSGDYWVYIGGTNYWRADGVLGVSGTVFSYGKVGARSYYYNDVDFVRLYTDDAGAPYKGVLIGDNDTAVGTYTTVTFPTANKDYANKTGIGTASAVGQLLAVTGGTGATKEVYRIITIVSADSVQVDRNIHAAGTNITDGSVIIYKDVIGFFATDGTNGQRIMNYSAQDKPLQLGGDVLIATTNMGTEDVLIGNVLGWVNRTTEPGGALTNGIMVYAEDSADATSAMSWRTEQVTEVIGTFTESDKIKIQINGTWYWISLDAV